jgi:hypothetical protein
VLLVLLVCFMLVGLAADRTTSYMRSHLNGHLSQDRKLPPWPRSYRRVNTLYEEQNPASILPRLSRGCGYLMIALFVVMVLTGLVVATYGDVDATRMHG